jgi:NAD kinase
MRIEVRNVMDPKDLKSGGKTLNIFADGRARGEFRPGDVVRIRKHPARLHIIRPKGSSYFDALRNKLGWTGDRDLRSGAARLKD